MAHSPLLSWDLQRSSLALRLQGPFQDGTHMQALCGAPRDTGRCRGLRRDWPLMVGEIKEQNQLNMFV
uniref:Uncharacterized protein n=1 Tax=Knipowitschia caucasica TaxID=637954 RepID=A0AAV2LEW7_KNICA